MIQTKNTIYKRAYTELNEIIKELSKAELEKIPSELIRNIELNIDKEYKWKYDKSKTLLDQDLMPETKALIVEIYEKYLCPENEKEFWKEYDKICINKIEEQKKAMYNGKEIFRKLKKYLTSKVMYAKLSNNKKRGIIMETKIIIRNEHHKI